MRDAPPPRATPVAPKVGQDRPRLAVIEGVAITTPLDPYLTLRVLAAYSGCSVRWLRDRLVDAHHALPCFRLPGGKVLVRRSDFDGWVSRYRAVGRADVDRVVTDVLRGLTGGASGRT
jgi:hypothetical protein